MGTERRQRAAYTAAEITRAFERASVSRFVERGAAQRRIIKPEVVRAPLPLATLVRLLEVAAPAAGDHVLVAGVSSHFLVEVSARMVAEVTVVESEGQRAERLRDRVRREGITNVGVRAGDPADGWEERAPFDTVLADGPSARDACALPLQVADGGRLVQLRGTGRHERQVVTVRRDAAGNPHERDHGLVRACSSLGEDEIARALEALRASQTGHLVPSTLHCNESTGCVLRLLDLGQDRHSLAAEQLGVLAQRLARRICTSCRVEVGPDPKILAGLFPAGAPGGFRALRSRGCSRCNGVGSVGRIAVSELLVVGDAERHLIATGAPPRELRRQAADGRMVPMRDRAVKLVESGVVPLEDLPRILSVHRMAEGRV